MSSKPDRPQILNIQDLNFFLGDRLAQFIVKDITWSPLRVGISAYIVFLLISIINASLSNTLLPNPNFRALLDDFYYWVADTVLVPLAWGYYIWIVSAPRIV